MLINRSPDEDSGRVGDVEMQKFADNSNEYQTSEEVYQTLTKNNIFEGDGDKAPATRDLVILYKNVDDEFRQNNRQTNKNSNQYVENVKYNNYRGSDASDLSEDFSIEDFNHLFAINDEKIDLLNNFGDTLCHKFGDMEMHTSRLTNEYDRRFQFNDIYIKEQLRSFHAFTKSKPSNSTVLPASLLDYICCKQLEDNYNFYMDNVIKYVQNTIEQLKSISNGDYLTEKAKKEWRKVGTETPTLECTKMILASSVSIPIYIEEQLNQQKRVLDNIVHSEMDLKPLCSNIFQKKVVIQIPKSICGTYSLFGKRCKDNFTITCKKYNQHKASRVDVVLKLQRSISGHIITDIDLKSLPTDVVETDTRSNKVLALEFERDQSVQQNKIIEIARPSLIDTTVNNLTEEIVIGDEETYKDDYNFPSCSNCQEDNVCSSVCAKNDVNITATDHLHCIIQRLSMQSPVLEENEDNLIKNKSPTRIKSPYENKSYLLQEKKRKKLLEIREKRVIKKNALGENCVKKKHRHGKNIVMAQASNSVTKLSITNKYFYNSIYGQSTNNNSKNSRNYYKKQARDTVQGIEQEEKEETVYKDSLFYTGTTPQKNIRKYTNRSYYLDDADTEVMHLQKEQNESEDVTKDDLSTSTATNELGIQLNLLQQLVVSSTTELSLTDTSSSLPLNISFNDSFVNETESVRKNPLMSTQSTQVSVAMKSLKMENENSNTTSSIECRKSIDKIYNLIKTVGKKDSLEVITSKIKIDESNNDDKLQPRCNRDRFCMQASDSETCIKYSSPSYVDLEKTDTDQDNPKKKPMPIISKVTISLKSQNHKFNSKINPNNEENKKLYNRNIQENPLKAISQLIRKFDDVQKNINKNRNHLTNNKKRHNLTSEDKSNCRQNFLKRVPKQNQYLKDSEAIPPKPSVLKDRRRQSNGYGPFDIIGDHLQPEEKPKKIADIIDEVKELRGEAVRGPSKKMTRLNNLAQPKTLFSQPQKEELQNRFKKRVTDRLSKQTPPTLNAEKRVSFLHTRNKMKKVSDAVSASRKQAQTLASSTEKTPTIISLTHKSSSRAGDDMRSPVTVSRSPGNVSRIPELRNDKMAAVATYVKSHYGRESQPLEFGNSHNAHKSRIPLMINNINLVSGKASLSSSPPGSEESIVLGNKLHHMIDNMNNSNIAMLGALVECKESISRIGEGLDNNFVERIMKSDAITLSGSDYKVDIFEDKNIETAVSNIIKENRDYERGNKSTSNTNIRVINQQLPYRIQHIDNALYRQISNGAFKKSLRNKNLGSNITSKQSLQNVSIWKSAMTSSLALKSKSSISLDLKIDTFPLEKMFPVFSNKPFRFTKFPIQIATVGYALPYLIKCDSISEICSIENDYKLKSLKSNIISKNITVDTALSDKTVQCFKDKPKVELRESVCNVLTTENKKKDVLEDCAECFIELLNNEHDTQKYAVETVNVEDNIEVDIKKSNIDNSTSLDILVGLLNEIKKITSYQTYIPTQETAESDINIENKDIQIILNKVATKESSVNQIANTKSSLDRLHILEARSNSIMCFASNIEDKETTNATTSTSSFYSPVTPSVDKEVNAKILQTKCMHNFTEVQARIFPVNTNPTASLKNLCNTPSSQSLHYFTDCKRLNTPTSAEITELRVPLNVSTKRSNIPNINIFRSPPILQIQHGNKREICANIKEITEERNMHLTVEYDPLMKMKRDILVTVYSILVLTVFAALSFPDILYRI